MQKKVLVMALAAIITLVLSMPVMAQTNPPENTLGSLSSNTSMATSGIFKNDVDNFINYHNYSSVLTDEAKWFGFVTGRTDAGGALDAGFAANLGKLYLGVWYRGNIYKINDANETRTITPVWDNNREVLLQTTDTIAYSGYKWQESANQIEFLLGVAGQGIKLGFLEWLASDRNPGSYAEGARNITVTDYQDGRKDYQNATVKYERSLGFLKPYLGWGTNIAIGSVKLMPYVDLGLQIFNDMLVDNYQSYTEVNGVNQNVVGTVGAGQNAGYLQPYGVIGAKLNFAKNGTVQPQLELRYGIDLRFYSNNYDATGLLGNVDGTVSWEEGYANRVTDYLDRTVIATDITLTINKLSYINHVITPTYKITGEPAEGFNLGFSAAVPVTIRSQSQLGYADRYEITKNDYKADKSMNYERTAKTRTYIADQNFETSDLIVALNLNFGAGYKLIPNRFTVNAGIGAVPVSFTHNEIRRLPNSVNSVATTTTNDASGNVTETMTVTEASDNNNNDAIIITDSWNQWTANLYGGFTFYFNSKAALDMGANSSVGSESGFNLNLTTVNVIFTFKF